MLKLEEKLLGEMLNRTIKFNILAAKQLVPVFICEFGRQRFALMLLNVWMDLQVLAVWRDVNDKV